MGGKPFLVSSEEITSANSTKTAGTAVTDGSMAVPWTSGSGLVTALATQDSTYVSNGITSDFSFTDILVSTNYGFAVSGTITGIEVMVRCQASAADGTADAMAMLRKSSGTVGSNKAVGTTLSSSFVNMTYGGPTDLWGTTWTPAEINASTFGFSYQATVEGFRAINIDQIAIKVYYTGGGGSGIVSLKRDVAKPLQGWGANNDPYWSNVVALHRFEGADGSTSFIDTGPTARTYTTNGNAQLDDAQTIHGLTSGLFDGAGDFLTTPDQLDFRASQAGDFTVEAVIRLSVTGGKIHTICCKRASAGNAGEFSFSVDSNNKLNLSIFNINPWSAIGATTLVPDVWYRVACERYGTALTVYLNGVVDGTGTQSGTPLSAAGTTFNIGRSVVNTARDFQGWINEFRMTRVARYQGSNYDCRPPAGGKYYSIAKQTGHIVDRLVTPTFTNLVKKTTAWAIDRVIDPTFTAIRRTFLPRTVTQANDPPTFASQLTKAPTALTTPLINRQTVIAKKIKSKSGRRGVQTASGYPELVGYQTDAGTPGGGFSLSIPANIQADDIAVVGAIWTDALDDPPYPYSADPAGGGWNLFFERGMNDAGYGGMMWKFWWKRLNGTEAGASAGASFTDGTLLSWIGAGITVWRGCEPDFPPIEEFQHRGPTTANPHQGQALPAAVDKCTLVTYILSTVDNVRGTPVEPAIEIDDYGTNSGNDGAFAMLYMPCPTVGTYGPIQHTMGGNYNYGSFSFMLKPSQPASEGGGEASGLDEIGTTAFVNKAFPYRITAGNAVVDTSLPMTNPDFETGDATGWSQIIGSNVQVRASGADGVTAQSGSWYGAGAANASVAWWGQTVSFSPSVWSFIDSGVVSVTLSVSHTGFTDADYGALYVECLNGSGVWLSDKRNNFSDPSTWTTETVTVLVPAGCRSLRISTQNVRVTGTQLSSYWDNFSPEVAPFAEQTVLRHDLVVSEKGNSIAGWTATTGTLAAVTLAITWLYDIIYAQSSASVSAYKDFTPAADTLSYIDAGTATIEMSVQLGGGNSEQDPIRVFVECLDASDVVLGTLQTAAVETAYTNTFTAFNLSMAVPALTRKFRVRYQGTRVTATNLDGYMARLSVFLLAVPTYVPPFNPVSLPIMSRVGSFARTFTPLTDGVASIYKSIINTFISAIDVVMSIDTVLQSNGEQYEQLVDALANPSTSIVRATDHYVQRTIDPVTALSRTLGRLLASTSTPAYSVVRSPAKTFLAESKGGAYTYGAHRYWRIRAPETNNSSGYLGFTKVKLRSSPGGTDLANGKTANASAIHGSYPPSNATDSNGSTFWTTVTAAAPAGGHWFSVDLGSGNDAEIVEVALTSRPDGFNEWPLYFVVEYSDNNSTWTPAWTPETWSTSWGNGVEKVFGRTTVVPAGYRYWRVRAPDTYVAGEYFGVAEMEMLENGYNRAGVATITASAVNGSYPVRNMVDSNTSTFWTTGAVGQPGGGHWARFDFLMPRNISEVRLRVRGDAFREDPAQLVIEYSSNGSTWTTQWTESTIAAWSAGQQRTFTDPAPFNYDVPAATLVRQTGHYINSVVDASASALRLLGRVFMAEVNTTAFIVKSTGKAIGSTIDVLGEMAKEFLSGVTQYNREFTGLADVVTALRKDIARTVNQDANSSALVMRYLGKSFAVAADVPAMVLRNLGKAFTNLGIAAANASRNTDKSVTRTVDTSSAVTRTQSKIVSRAIDASALLARTFGKAILRPVTATMSLVRNSTKSVTASTSGNGFFARIQTAFRTITAQTTGNGQTVKQSTRTAGVNANTEAEGIPSKAFLKLIASATTPLANGVRSLGRTVATVSNATVDAARGLFKTLTSSVGALGQSQKASPRTIGVTTTPEPDTITGKAYLRLANAVSNTSASAARMTSRLIAASTDTAAAASRTIARTFSQAANATVSAYRGLSKVFTSASATLVTTTVAKSATPLDVTATAEAEPQVTRQRISIITAAAMVGGSVVRDIFKSVTRWIDVWPQVRRQGSDEREAAPTRGGTQALGFAPAHEVRRKNRERLGEKRKKVTFQISYLGQVVNMEKDVSDTNLSVSLNILQKVQEAFVKIKSIFIQESKDVSPTVRIKKDDD